MKKKQIQKCFSEVKVFFLVVVLLGFFGLSLHAQEREITGQVVDEQGVPLVGASVIQKGTNNGAQTDFDGNFSIIYAMRATFSSYLSLVLRRLKRHYHNKIIL